MDAMEKSQRIENWLKENGSVQVAVSEYMAANPPMSVSRFLATNDCSNQPETGLEGILLPNGLYYDLRGSHSMMMNVLAAQTLDTTIENYMKSVPKVCYTAMTAYAMKITGAVMLHNNVQQYADELTQAQKDALLQLESANKLVVNLQPVRMPARIKVHYPKLVERQQAVLAAN